MPPLPQYAFMAWFSVKGQEQLYLCLNLAVSIMFLLAKLSVASHPVQIRFSCTLFFTSLCTSTTLLFGRWIAWFHTVHDGIAKLWIFSLSLSPSLLSEFSVPVGQCSLHRIFSKDHAEILFSVLLFCWSWAYETFPEIIFPAVSAFKSQVPKILLKWT